MKIKQTNAEGVEEEIEVMSPQEVQAKLDAEKATIEAGHKTVVTEKDTQINTLAQEKAALEKKIKDAELAGIKEDHPNFKILKDALGKKDEDIANLKKDIDTDKATRKQEAWDSKIKIATKGNEELEKKIRLHLKETLGSMPEDTEAQRQTKLESAFKLSSDFGSGPGIFDGGAGGGGLGNGGYGDGGGNNGPEFTGREKALGAKLGISEADYKKYGSKLTNKKS